MSKNGFYRGGVLKTIFPPHLQLLPNTNQLWEIDMAFGESQAMSDPERLIERSAFFARVHDRETFQYKICRASPLQVDKQSSLRRQTFFDANQFKTGYATHGLFPYRGKFHAQLIRAILNIIGIEKGEKVLDPMAGSGTVCIEAAINGIHSVGVDVSPFCSLMTKAKTKALDVNVRELRDVLLGGAALVTDELGIPLEVLSKRVNQGDLFAGSKREADQVVRAVAEETRDILLLCFLDAIGYAARRKNKTGEQLFAVIADRYLSAIEKFQRVREELHLDLGEVEVKTGDARELDLPDECVDGIITSPPYSFAIDYAENDRPQLEYLGHDVESLKSQMIGLIGGKSVGARVKSYFRDMKLVFQEMARVLKPGRCCVVVIGSNEVQTGGIRHEREFERFGDEVGFKLFWKMVRPIEGIHNSMRDEYVMFFQKP